MKVNVSKGSDVKQKSLFYQFINFSDQLFNNNLFLLNKNKQTKRVVAYRLYRSSFFGL